MSSLTLQSSIRLRSTPYKKQIEKHGVSGYSVVNHTILPKGFRRSAEEDYWHLRENVQLWDVGCQRQVEIKGSDAAHLVELMTPRDLSAAEVGQCFYAPVIDQKGGMLNDPVILKIRDDQYWLSISDSDLLLWAKGLALGLGLNVEVDEPNVWPMAVQGPKAEQLMAEVFGREIEHVKFFEFGKFAFRDHPLLIARSGFSKQGGFEIYLDRPELGDSLWLALWEAGQELDVAPGCPNLIERIEGGLLSYGNEMTSAENPYECGFDRFCQLNKPREFIGRAALLQVLADGVKKTIRGIKFGTRRCPPCSSRWPLRVADERVGYVTSAAWSPRFDTNVGLAMVDRDYWQDGQEIAVEIEDVGVVTGKVVALPM